MRFYPVERNILLIITRFVTSLQGIAPGKLRVRFGWSGKNWRYLFFRTGSLGNNFYCVHNLRQHLCGKSHDHLIVGNPGKPS